MKRILDCLVNYFGLDEEGRPASRRYFCYHIVAGPGPAPGAGVAAITTLAVSREEQRCTSCDHFHVVNAGGPAAAITRAIRYLDAYHEGDRMRRVQSQVRGLGDEPPAGIVPSTHPVVFRTPPLPGDYTPRA